MIGLPEYFVLINYCFILNISFNLTCEARFETSN